MDKLQLKIKMMYRSLDGIFTDKEAWGLFKIAAICETIGWSLLIVGIIFSVLHLPYQDYILPIAGSIHGILYLFYVFIVLFGHRALSWSVLKFLFAELISVIPYGALAFEIYESRKRKIIQNR